MPLTWEEARKNIYADEEFAAILGKEFVTNYLSVNQTLGDVLQQPSDNENDRLERSVEIYRFI
ncbi:hypothetical protein BDZ97DRAFT_1825870, partial [Flammula alnicola]